MIASGNMLGKKIVVEDGTIGIAKGSVGVITGAQVDLLTRKVVTLNVSFGPFTCNFVNFPNSAFAHDIEKIRLLNNYKWRKL